MILCSWFKHKTFFRFYLLSFLFNFFILISLRHCLLNLFLFDRKKPFDWISKILDFFPWFRFKYMFQRFALILTWPWNSFIINKKTHISFLFSTKWLLNCFIKRFLFTKIIFLILSKIKIILIVILNLFVNFSLKPLNSRSKKLIFYVSFIFILNLILYRSIITWTWFLWFIRW